MKVTDKMLNGRWTETQFKVEPTFAKAVPSRGPLERELEALKIRLLAPVLKTVAGANGALARELSRAANEAAALAWFTVCPVLVLPGLLEEKIGQAIKRWEKQQQLLRA